MRRIRAAVEGDVAESVNDHAIYHVNRLKVRRGRWNQLLPQLFVQMFE